MTTRQFTLRAIATLILAAVLAVGVNRIMTPSYDELAAANEYTPEPLRRPTTTTAPPPTAAPETTTTTTVKPKVTPKPVITTTTEPPAPRNPAPYGYDQISWDVAVAIAEQRGIPGSQLHHVADEVEGWCDIFLQMDFWDRKDGLLDTARAFGDDFTMFLAVVQAADPLCFGAIQLAA